MYRVEAERFVATGTGLPGDVGQGQFRAVTQGDKLTIGLRELPQLIGEPRELFAGVGQRRDGLVAGGGVLAAAAAGLGPETIDHRAEHRPPKPCPEQFVGPAHSRSGNDADEGIVNGVEGEGLVAAARSPREPDHGAHVIAVESIERACIAPDQRAGELSSGEMNDRGTVPDGLSHEGISLHATDGAWYGVEGPREHTRFYFGFLTASFKARSSASSWALVL